MSSSGPLQAFVERHVHRVDRAKSSAKVDPERALHVERVAATSVAASAGIAPGDLLVRVDRFPASTIDFDSLLDPETPLPVDLSSPRKGERMRLTTTGIPLGLELSPTTEAVERRFTDGTWELDDLDVLWKREAWEVLERVCRRIEKPAGFAGFLQKIKKKEPAWPTRLLLGAALVETGRVEEGMQLVESYLPDEHYHTLQYHAMARYTVAIAAYGSGNRDDALRWMIDAWKHQPLERIADRLEEWTGTRPDDDRGRWKGQRLPVAYELPRVESSGRVSLEATLTSMGAGQVLPVVLLANYRANGPYSDLMKTWTRFSIHFESFLPSLHVVTMETERREDRPHWFEGEEHARAHGRTFELLHDADGAVTMACEPAGSPWVLLLDRHGTVLAEGGLEEIELWDALAAAG